MLLEFAVQHSSHSGSDHRNNEDLRRPVFSVNDTLLFKFLCSFQKPTECLYFLVTRVPSRHTQKLNQCVISVISFDSDNPFVSGLWSLISFSSSQYSRPSNPMLLIESPWRSKLRTPASTGVCPAFFWPCYASSTWLRPCMRWNMVWFQDARWPLHWLILLHIPCKKER